MFNNITSGMMDIASKIEAMGFKTSLNSTPEGYKGSVDERLTAIVREVYSEKQRKWACAQDDPKFDEMCKDTAISKKKKMKEEVTDKEEGKLKKIEKELNKASKMHKSQADRIGGLIKKTSPALLKLSASCKAAAKKKFKVYPSAYANMWASKTQKKGKC